MQKYRYSQDQIFFFFFFQEGAYADVEVKLGLIKLLHKEFDLCQEAYAFKILAV